MSEPRYVTTRAQLIDAIAGLSTVAVGAPGAYKIVADDLADLILARLSPVSFGPEAVIDADKEWVPTNYGRYVPVDWLTHGPEPEPMR